MAWPSRLDRASLTFGERTLVAWRAAPQFDRDGTRRGSGRGCEEDMGGHGRTWWGTGLCPDEAVYARRCRSYRLFRPCCFFPVNRSRFHYLHTPTIPERNNRLSLLPPPPTTQQQIGDENPTSTASVMRHDGGRGVSFGAARPPWSSGAREGFSYD